MQKKYFVEIFILKPEFNYEGFSFSPDLSMFEKQAFFETFVIDSHQYIMEEVLSKYPTCGYFMVHQVEEIHLNQWRPEDRF